MSRTDKINVVITGAGGGGVGHQLIKSLRLAGDRYHIVATDMTKHSVGLHFADAQYIVPVAKNNEYIGRLVNICKEEKAAVLIPGSEPELRVIAENLSEFKSVKVLPLINDGDVIRQCMDKWKTYQLLKSLDIDCPTSWMDADLNNVEFPVIIKPSLGGGGSFNCYIAQEQGELEFFVDYVKKQGIVPIIQQYVGTPNEEYTVGVLTDMQSGELIESFALRRYILSGLSNRLRIINRYPDESRGDLIAVSSGISQGELGNFPEVRHCCEQAALKIGSRGPMNIQCRRVGDKVYIFEINPRFSGTSYMRAMMGFNEPDILIKRQIFGQKTELNIRRDGLILRGLEERHINY